jgi:2-polyprenyl-6-methoxyphenol hydroxylase-like FAD-dependent oxidoreductase
LTKPINEILILDGGLAGLAAGCILTKAGLGVKVFEKRYQGWRAFKNSCS